MENLMRITSEFREIDMQLKLKEGQDVWVNEYQHRGDYVEGDKVWFQPLNGNAWIGPAAVVCQQGQSVYLHTHSDLKKIAACRVKPFELIDQDEDSVLEKKKELMTKDGLEDVESLYSDLKNDGVSDNCLKMAQSISFSEFCTYNVEIPLSEHWRPEQMLQREQK